MIKVYYDDTGVRSKWLKKNFEDFFVIEEDYWTVPCICPDIINNRDIVGQYRD